MQKAFALASKTDALNAHLDACALCREAQRHDADLCEEGERLSRDAAQTYLNARRQRLAEINQGDR
jgi:hypothetical protein